MFYTDREVYLPEKLFATFS